MEYFALLTVTTLVIIVLALVLYQRTRDAGVLIGMAALYYWTLFGAWSIVIDKTGGHSGKSYYYLEHKLFPISLDSNYLLTLGLYAGFLISIQVTLLLCLSKKRKKPISRLVLRHDPILIGSLIAGVASFAIIYDKLNAAWLLHTSAYWYTRSQT